MSKLPRVLVACEYSGIVREAFKNFGCDAWSCDLLDTEIPGKHIRGDVLEILNDGWDLMIAHPPCTYLSVAGSAWINRRPERKIKMIYAAEFFKELLNCKIKNICIENPVIYLAAIKIIGKKYDQVINPFQFGEPYKKRTCLWLKNLSLLIPTNIIKPVGYWVNSSSNYGERGLPIKGLTHDAKNRSRSFKGIADAMASQWSP